MRATVIVVASVGPKRARPVLSNVPTTVSTWPSSVSLPVKAPVLCTAAVKKPSVLTLGTVPSGAGSRADALTSPL